MTDIRPLEDIGSVLSILSQISIFGGTTEKQLGEIFDRLECRGFKKGEALFRQGDEPDHLYIVRRGRVVILLGDDKLVVQKKELGVGELLGHVAFISMQRHLVTAVAAEDSEVMLLSRRALIGLRHEDIELFALLMMNIARELARRLSFTDKMLMGHLRVEERAIMSGAA